LPVARHAPEVERFFIRGVNKPPFAPKCLNPRKISGHKIGIDTFYSEIDILVLSPPVLEITGHFLGVSNMCA
jgi:hypothetical protein